jgi:hypothetical protein
MATTLSNKAVINFYGFDYPLFLTMFQVCTATRILLLVLDGCCNTPHVRLTRTTARAELFRGAVCDAA